MKKSILKSQPFEWISFHDFIDELKVINPNELLWIRGRPASGMFHGTPVEHKHHSLYLIGLGSQQVRFTPDDVLCFTEENTPFLLKHPLAEFVNLDTKTEEYGREFVSEEEIKLFASDAFNCGRIYQNDNNVNPRNFTDWFKDNKHRVLLLSKNEYSIKESVHEKSLRLMDEYLTNTPKEEIDKQIAEIDEMFQGKPHPFYAKLKSLIKF